MKINQNINESRQKNEITISPGASSRVLVGFQICAGAFNRKGSAMRIKIETEGGNIVELHDIHADDKIVDVHIEDRGKDLVTLQVAKKDLLAAVKAICR